MEEDAELFLLEHVSASRLTSVKAQRFDQVFPEPRAGFSQAHSAGCSHLS